MRCQSLRARFGIWMSPWMGLDCDCDGDDDDDDDENDE